jgi:hypothetical protein
LNYFNIQEPEEPTLKKQKVNHSDDIKIGPSQQEKIKVIGNDVPSPVVLISDLALFSPKKYLLENLATGGYNSPTPIQQYSWGCMMKVRLKHE